MKKGFTLIEMIAVIFILALILLIVVPIVNNNIIKSRDTLSEEQKHQLELAARQWSLENLTLEKVTGKYCISLSELQRDGYLDDKAIKNIEKNEDMLNMGFIITKVDNQFNYRFANIFKECPPM